jgi:hypothetical protein
MIASGRRRILIPRLGERAAAAAGVEDGQPVAVDGAGLHRMGLRDLASPRTIL